METPEEKARVDFSAPAESPTQASPAQEPPQSPSPRPSWIEVLVDPRTLQGLMSCGGGLLVLGLVTWLWAIGLFENKLIVASCLGVANFGLLAVGLVGARFSRYQTASKALTMLSCLVMPLNLWFYDAQGLITLDQGGHLWVPALICCGLYVLVARLTSDPLYVNAIVGGVTMMGLLILADQGVGRFWEIMAPSSFLVVLGMVCIHVERAFPPEPGRFSRDNFGRAFFSAGHFVMGLGLIVLLAGRLAGRLYDPYLSNFDWAVVPEVASQTTLRLAAIGLALAGAYSYLYSQLVVRATGRFLVPAMLTLVWAAIMVLDLLRIPLTLDLVMVLTAVGALVCGLTSKSATETDDDGETKFKPIDALLDPLRNASGDWVPLLNYATLGLGLLVFARVRFLADFWESASEFSAMYVVAALIGSLTGWLTVRTSVRSQAQTNLGWQIQSCAILFALAIDALMVCLGFQLSVLLLSLQMLIPLSLAVAALRTCDEGWRHRLALAAETIAMLFLLVAVGAMFGFVHGVAMTGTHVGLAIYFLLVASSLGLSSNVSKRVLPATLTAVSICVAAWQLLLGLGITHYVFLMATSLVGLVCLAMGRVVERSEAETNQFVVIGQWIGRLCILYGSVATLLIALARLVSGESTFSMLGMVALQAAAGGVAGCLSKEAGWRRHFWVLATVQLLMFLLVANSLTALGFWQRGEMFLTVGGLVALALGYLGWYGETEREEEFVSFNLAMGSFLSAVPLTIGMLIQRFDSQIAPWGWGLLHEAGVLSIGLLLLGAGVLCRIRSSTIVGGTTLIVYVVSLVGMVHLPEQLQTTAIYMMVGGGLFFGGALLLSIYRDRLLAIPQRMQDGEGVFRVLKWR